MNSSGYIIKVVDINDYLVVISISFIVVVKVGCFTPSIVFDVSKWMVDVGTLGVDDVNVVFGYVVNVVLTFLNDVFVNI